MGAHDPQEHDSHRHDGHGQEGLHHLAHLPASAAPAVFAARADVAFRAPVHVDQLEDVVTRFLAALSDGLADAGCTLVGHIKGTLAARDRGDLAFHVTTLGAEPALTGGTAGALKQGLLTVNVIVFGVDEAALPAMVMDAWSRASGAETDWR
jgi:hypothetical protein